jgi:Helix-turn-helix of DDE superfamily endonuclease
MLNQCFIKCCIVKWQKAGGKEQMHYEELKHLSDGQFKRLCGVTRGTFADMVIELRPLLERSGKRGGQPKLSTENQLLVVLEYWREYRTHFHIGVSWGLHETTVGRLIRKVEDRLIQCGKFRLPSQRHLYQAGEEMTVMVVDVAEMKIERPKKTEKVLQWKTEVPHNESSSAGSV